MSTASPKQQGFTLIELLVVILIVGLAVGMVSMNVGSSTDLMKLRNELRDFINHSSIVMDESIMSGKTFGIDLYQDMDDDGNQRYGYRWLVLSDNKEWVPVEVKDLPSDNFFSVDAVPSLQIDNNDVDVDIGTKIEYIPKKEGDENNTELAQETELSKDPIKPDIFISSSGEISPFFIELVLEDKDESSRLSVKAEGDLLGRMRILEGDEDDY